MRIKKFLVLTAAALMLIGCGKDSTKESTDKVKASDSGVIIESSSASESSEVVDKESSSSADVVESSSAVESSSTEESSSENEPEESSADEPEESSSVSEADLLPADGGFESIEEFLTSWKELMKKYYAYEKLVFFFEEDEEKMDEISFKAADDVFRLINATELKAACEFMKKAGLFDGSEDDFVALIKKDLAKDAKESLKYATEYLLVEDEAMSAMTLNEVFTTWEFPEKAFHEWNLDEFFEEYSENEISQVLKELGLEGVIETDGLELLPEDSDDKSIGFDFVDDDIAIAKYDGKWYFSVFAI